MPSTSYQAWATRRASSLDEIAHAHVAVGGTKRGRRYATQQINHAYAVLLASQFQGFCRDLHSECVDRLVSQLEPVTLQPLIRADFTWGRQLDKGNARSGSLGADFGRLGIEFWREVEGLDPANSDRKSLLDLLNQWRNAIAHQDFDRNTLGARTLRIAQLRAWRTACNRLAKSFDEALRRHLQSLTGQLPW